MTLAERHAAGDPSVELVYVPVYEIAGIGRLHLVEVLEQYGANMAKTLLELKPGEPTRVQIASYEDGASVWTSYVVKRLGGGA